MNFKYLTLLILLYFSISNEIIFSQTYEVSGKIADSKTNKPLEYVTVKIADTTYGTTSEKNGEYFIRLKPGEYNIIFSYIGYFSDTTYILVEDKDITRNIFLTPSEILTEAIEVYGEDPAYEIVRRAIKYKKEFRKHLNEYEYDAFTKFVIRSNQSDIPPPNIDGKAPNKDQLGIFGILESVTKGYFKSPDLVKQVVISKKETANIARGFALPFIVNFYEEEIDMNEFKIPTPLSDNAFDHYDYRLMGTTSIDSTLIYKVKVINRSENIPELKGTIYISDSTYALLSVDVTNNNAAKPLGIDKMHFMQKFSPFQDSKNPDQIFWMPTDVQIFADGSFLGLLKFEAEVFSIVSHYDLNKKAPAGIFDDIIIKVMPDAKKDSAYWSKNELIKNTPEEKNAYKEIEKEDEKKSRSLNFGFTSMSYGKKFFTNPASYYLFNRVEGSALAFDLLYREPLRKRTAGGYFRYGFSDKKSKYEINYSQRFFNDRRLIVSASAFQKIMPMAYEQTIPFQILYNTLKALFDKKDNLDYYYSTGYDIGMVYRFIPQLTTGLDYTQAKQTTAFKNTNYSIRKQNVEFSNNPPINNAFLRTINAVLTINPNKFRGIDWGDGDISRFRITRYPLLKFGFLYSGKSLGSTYEYRRFYGSFGGQNYVNAFINLRYEIGGEIMTGQVPYQSLGYFNSRSGTIDINNTFQATVYNEFRGDQLYYFNLQNNFGKTIWGGIPVLKNFNLIGFFNAGRNFISEENYELAAFKNVTISDGIYMEAGFGINRILDVFRLDFAWRLNNPYNNNTRFFTNLSIGVF